MVWSFSKTFELMAGPCSPKHGLVLFTVLSNLFVWMFCSRLNTFKFMAGPRSQTSHVTAQLRSRRWRIVSFWFYGDIQQRSNERMFVLPQTRSRAFHGVEELFRLDGMKLFKNSRIYGWAVFPQTRPSSFHGVEEFILMDVMQPCKNIQVDGWAALPNILCPGPAHFAALKNHFVLMLCRHSTTFKWTDGRALPNTAQPISRCWKPSHLDGMKRFKIIRTYGWVVLPQTRFNSFHGVEESICMDVLQPCKNIQVYGWAAFPNIPCHGPAHIAALKTRFVL